MLLIVMPTALLDVPNQCIGKLCRSSGTPEVSRAYHVVIQCAVDGPLELRRKVRPLHVAEHHGRSEDQRQRVRDSLARDVGRRSVNGLEYGHAMSDIRAWSHPEAANESGNLI